MHLTITAAMTTAATTTATTTFLSSSLPPLHPPSGRALINAEKRGSHGLQQPHRLNSVTVATLSSTKLPARLTTSVINKNVASRKRTRSTTATAPTSSTTRLATSASSLAEVYPNQTDAWPAGNHTATSASSVGDGVDPVVPWIQRPNGGRNGEQEEEEEKQYLYTAILITFYATVVLSALMIAVWREKRQEIIVGNWDEYTKIRNVFRRVLCLEPLRLRREHDSVRESHLLEHSETSIDFLSHQDV